MNTMLALTCCHRWGSPMAALTKKTLRPYFVTILWGCLYGKDPPGPPHTPQLPSNSLGRSGLGESSPLCHSLASHLVGPMPEALPNGRDSHSPG